MAFYRHLGPISFHTQSKTAQIFITQNHYLLQSKTAYSYTDTKKQLKDELHCIADATNRQFNKQIMQVYQEQGKSVTLMIDRNLGSFDQIDANFTSKSIEILCVVCRILINSFTQLGIKKINSEIQSKMIFKFNNVDDGFYVYLPMQDIENHENINICQAIINYLQHNFKSGFQTSNKLLMSKLKKCNSLEQMKQELQYFQHVYQIGTKKVQKQLKQAELRPKNGSNDSKRNHRIYRKRSQQFHEESEKQILPIALSPFMKKSCSSQHRQHQNKRSINISNFPKENHKHSQTLSHQSLHQRSNRTPKISMFSNRNKSSKGLHSGTGSSWTSTHRTTMQNFGGFRKSNTKGIFQNNISNRSKNKQSKDRLYHTGNIGFERQRLYIDNYINSCASGFSTNNSQVSQKQNTGIAFQTHDLHLPITNIKQENRSENMMKHQVSELNAWRQIVKDQNNRHQSRHEQRVKTGRKQKLSKLDSNQINFINQHVQQLQLHTIQANDGEEKRKLVNCESMQKDRIQRDQRETVRMKESEIINNKTKNNNKHEQVLIEQIKLVKQTKKQNEPQITKLKSLNTEPQKLIEAPTSIPCELNKQKSKTIRKNGIMQKIQENIIKFGKLHIDRINIIGECVSNMPKYLSSDVSGEKILWQLPAFVLYKQFYIRRLKLEEKLKEQSISLKQDSDQIRSLISQISTGSAQALQSLSKLLKTVLKKLKKYNVDPAAVQQLKSLLNMDMSVKWSKKSDDLILNLLTELEDMAQQGINLLSLMNQIVDGYFVIKQKQIDFEQRHKMQITQNKKQLQSYYARKMAELNMDTKK